MESQHLLPEFCKIVSNHNLLGIVLLNLPDTSHLYILEIFFKSNSVILVDDPKSSSETLCTYPNFKLDFATEFIIKVSSP